MQQLLPLRKELFEFALAGKYPMGTNPVRDWFFDEVEFVYLTIIFKGDIINRIPE